MGKTINVLFIILVFYLGMFTYKHEKQVKYIFGKCNLIEKTYDFTNITMITNIENRICMNNCFNNITKSIEKCQNNCIKQRNRESRELILNKIYELC